MTTRRAAAWDGLRTGAGLGLCLSAASLAVSFLLRRVVMHLPPDGLDRTALWLTAWTGFVSAVLGGVSGAVRPAWVTRTILAAFLGLAAFGAYPGAEAGAVVLGGLLFITVRAANRRWPRVTLPAVGVGVSLAVAPQVAEVPAASGTTATAEGDLDVLLVVFDTVRADRTGVGGYTGATTPNLDRLAEESVVFHQAWAPASWTLPSHASMFTGLYPSRHGCHDEHLSLDETVPTLAGHLSARGWATGLFASNVWVGDATGLGRGFDLRVDAWRSSSLIAWFPAALLLSPWLDRDKGATAADAAFVEWLGGLRRETPMFAVVNYLEAHTPYHELAAEDRDGLGDARAASVAYERFLYARPDGPGPTEEERADLLRLYDAGVRSDDRHLGVLLDALAAAGRLERTLIIVTSDHGEAFGEDGRWEHHIHASEEVVHVPLVVRLPSRRYAGVQAWQDVSLVDLFPTVLDVAGLADVADLDGRSLLATLAADAPSRPVYFEGFPPEAPPARRRVAALGGEPDAWRWTGVRFQGGQFVDGPIGASGDPTLRERLTTRPTRRRLAADGEVALDPEARRRLEALGYME